MKWIRNIFGAVLLMFGMNACFETPTYPTTPQIEFIDNDFYFGKSASNDSIVIVLKFKDGDGDLGLSDTDNDAYKFTPKYNYRTGNGYDIVNYEFKRKNPSFIINMLDETKRPLSDFDFVTPYNCTNWEIKRDANNIVTDTVFVLFNENYYNIFVDFYTKNTDGTFTRFDPTTYFKYPNCSNSFYNGRFPILSKDLGKSFPLDGKITYSLKGIAFENIFTINKTMKLKIRIQDRALNKSNEVTSKEFTLASIRR